MAKAFNFEPDQAFKKKGGAKIERRAYGLVKARSEQFPIRKDIKDAVRKRYCAVLHTKAQIEVDHKDGRKDSWITNDVNLQQLDDFQALHQTANKVKRQVCKDCDTNNQRFDARVLGFPCGWTEGGAQYQGTCRVAFGTTRLPSVSPLVPKRLSDFVTSFNPAEAFDQQFPFTTPSFPSIYSAVL